MMITCIRKRMSTIKRQRDEMSGGKKKKNEHHCVKHNMQTTKTGNIMKTKGRVMEMVQVKEGRRGEN